MLTAHCRICTIHGTHVFVFVNLICLPRFSSCWTFFCSNIYIHIDIDIDIDTQTNASSHSFHHHHQTIITLSYIQRTCSWILKEKHTHRHTHYDQHSHKNRNNENHTRGGLAIFAYKIAFYILLVIKTTPRNTYSESIIWCVLNPIQFNCRFSVILS